MRPAYLLLLLASLAACAADGEGILELQNNGKADGDHTTVDGYLRDERPLSFLWTCDEDFCALDLVFELRPSDGDIEALHNVEDGTSLAAVAVSIKPLEPAAGAEVATSHYARYRPDQAEYGDAVHFLPRPRGVYEISLEKIRDRDALVREYHFSLSAYWSMPQDLVELRLTSATLKEANPFNDHPDPANLSATIEIARLREDGRESHRNSHTFELPARAVDALKSAAWTDVPVAIVPADFFGLWDVYVNLGGVTDGDREEIESFSTADGYGPLDLDVDRGEFRGTSSYADVTLALVPIE